MTDVTVVGAGVVGLTTAWALRCAGVSVQVVTADRPEATTSAAAGALWFPFQVGPPDRVNAWARSTREWLAWLAESTPEAGVDVLTVTECADGVERPWWADAVEELRFVDRPQPSGAAHAWRFEAPRVVPAIHLRWRVLLERPFPAAGAAARGRAGEVVVNCTGIGARRLVPDSLTALLGQTVTEPVLGPARPTATSVTPRRCSRHPRGRGGGRRVRPARSLDVPPARPRPAPAIARADQAALRHGPPLRDAVGLRGVRATVRWNASAGSSITTAWRAGCAGLGSAQEVVALIEAQIDRMIAPEDKRGTTDTSVSGVELSRRRGRGPSP